MIGEENTSRSNINFQVIHIQDQNKSTKEIKNPLKPIDGSILFKHKSKKSKKIGRKVAAEDVSDFES